MKSWGHYQIVNSSADADLLFEIRQSVSVVVLSGGASSYNPEFRLEVLDPKTNTLLWGFNVQAAFGSFQKASDQNFDQAIERLVMDMQRIASSVPSANGNNAQ
jgi:hypothetical protein